MSNPNLPLFRADDRPLKFFVQKDIPDNLRIELEDAIRQEGGTVEPKVPIRGYVVLMPETEEAQRLVETWRSADRPLRYFVPYTWINSCREDRHLHQQIFVQNGFPVKIHIHKSIANLNTRENLANTIKLIGGDPMASSNEATVILASNTVQEFTDMRKKLQGSEEKFVEDIQWLHTCIGQNFYYHTPNPARNPGGRRAGDERVPFTQEDEVNLCNWLASEMPFKDVGGRTGNKVYKNLEAKAGEPGFEWVGRHTWQSWRERYKKHRDRLDKHIAAIVQVKQADLPPPPESQYSSFRLNDADRPNPRKRRRVDERPHESSVAEVAPEPSTSTAIINSQDSEWAIRVGNDQPIPTWARQASIGASNEQSVNQSDVNSTAVHAFALASTSQSGTRSTASYNTGTNLEPEIDIQNPLVEREIQTISTELHFFADEIRAYYIRTRDLTMTRQRFQRLRTIIDMTP